MLVTYFFRISVTKAQQKGKSEDQAYHLGYGFLSTGKIENLKTIKSLVALDVAFLENSN